MIQDREFIITQLSVFLDNRLASLAELTRHLANKGINLRALSIAETRDFGTIRIIVADPDACAAALHEAGYHFIETDVLAIEVADKPGGMADVLEIIARERIIVEYAYAMVEKREGFAVVILRVDDASRACMVLKAKGIHLLRKDDIALL
ncbi:MAG: amino acid-binding protein [Deltaproteobacteria bacterium]|nr:amino acid-binding protein [Deltaproteobacteria bacterium]